jgi:photosystem II stability/assembly factor-like uncharacterized protein
MNQTARVVSRIAAVAVGAAMTVAPGTTRAAPGTAVTRVPAGFRANSLAWVSARHGFVLGAISCGATPCAAVIATRDGGRTWRLAGRLAVPITNLGLGRPGVTGIRFATPAVGWAFGPGLYRTGDGGRSWAREAVPGHGTQVLDLATGGGHAYAVVSDCGWGPGLCGRPLSFWRTTAGRGRAWARIPLDLPGNGAAGVAVSGSTVYVVDSQVIVGRSDTFYASTDGRRFASRPVPCANAADAGLVQVVPVSVTRVALLCDGNPGFSKAVKSVYVSDDTAKTDAYAGRMGLAGIQAQLAASPSGNLAVASWSDGSFLYINDSHRTAWTMVAGLGDGGAGWNDITYVTGTRGWVVYGPADAGGIGQLWVTRDGGRRWAAVRL